MLVGRTNDLADEVAGRQTQPSVLRKVSTPSVIRSTSEMPFTNVQLMPKTPDSQRVMNLVQREMAVTIATIGPKLAQAAIIPALTGGGSAAAALHSRVRSVRAFQWENSPRTRRPAGPDRG